MHDEHTLADWKDAGRRTLAVFLWINSSRFSLENMACAGVWGRPVTPRQNVQAPRRQQSVILSFLSCSPVRSKWGLSAETLHSHYKGAQLWLPLPLYQVGLPRHGTRLNASILHSLSVCCKVSSLEQYSSDVYIIVYIKMLIKSIHYCASCASRCIL